ncbi:MAG: hypothetical protein NW223_12525 [Hyphomicrobiaceae bacterium]|nr:hypothetical protein [Hyphomicrobiaceae bacterium]
MANDPSSTGIGAVPGANSGAAQGGDERTLEAGAGPAVAQGAAPGTFPANLTQELAHLIAASIAQQGGIKMPSQRPGGTPTNSDLASLAAIMSGSQPARKPLPLYRDELSSLNYNRPAPPAPLRPPHEVYQQPQPHDLGAHIHDDEPMPIPSTWRQPAMHDEDRPFGKQVLAAGMGLVAGLVVVVPAVLWLTGAFGPIKSKLDGRSVQASSESRAAKLREIDASADAPPFTPAETAAVVPQEPPSVTTASMTKAAPFADGGQQIERVLVQARQKIDGGDVLAAREILAGEAPLPPLLFALAETYDPNMLAAWGSRGVTADVQRARALYARALEQGYGRALPRLDALR